MGGQSAQRPVVEVRGLMIRRSCTPWASRCTAAAACAVLLLSGACSSDDGDDLQSDDLPELDPGLTEETGVPDEEGPGDDDASGDVGGSADEVAAEGVAECRLGPVPEPSDPEVLQDPVEFTVDGDTAVMVGSIGDDIVHRVCDLVASNPSVGWVEVLDVPGSSTLGNETLDAGLALRAAGLATLVPRDGQVESGGVDLFLAGTERNVLDGGCLGVHSTEIDTEEGPIAAADLPRDDPEHEPFLDYFRAVGVAEEFYWFTLDAAAPGGIHYVTPAEMERYGLVTGAPPTEACPLSDE